MFLGFFIRLARTKSLYRTFIDMNVSIENARVKAMYIVGLPADTVNTYAKTFDYAKKVKSTYAQFNVFTPYPGTPVYKEYEDKIFAKKFEEFTQCQLVFKHKNLRSEDITKMLDNSYKSYYTNPSWILKYIYYKIKNIISLNATWAITIFTLV